LQAGSPGRAVRRPAGARASAPAGPVPLTCPVAGFTGSLPAGGAWPGNLSPQSQTSRPRPGCRAGDIPLAAAPDGRGASLAGAGCPVAAGIRSRRGSANPRGKDAMTHPGRLPGPVAERWGWQLAAACRGADPALFFPADSERGPHRAAREAAARRSAGAARSGRRARRTRWPPASPPGSGAGWPSPTGSGSSERTAESSKMSHYERPGQDPAGTRSRKSPAMPRRRSAA